MIVLQVEELRGQGLEPYAYKWERTHTANQLQDIYRNLGNGEESTSESDCVSVAGRIVARRAFGKLAFLTLRDDSGTIQVGLVPVHNLLLLFSIYFPRLLVVSEMDESIYLYWKDTTGCCVGKFSQLTWSRRI